MTINRATVFKYLFFTYLITVLCLMVLTIKTEQIDIPKQLFGIKIDKIIHFLLFFPYPILAWLTFYSSISGKIKNWTIPLIFISGLFLASLTEFSQLFNSNRSFDPKDMIANYIAIVSGTIVITIISLFRKNASQQPV